MNAGILTSGYAAPTMPNRLLGSPTAVRVPIGLQQEWHPEAIDWTRRAAANGGRWTLQHLQAINNFCIAVDAAGVRSRFMRLSLIAGANLNAALVPLYISTSLGGTQYGYTTDTNYNLVSGDYSQAGGITAGATGASAAAKWLMTGITPKGVFDAGFTGVGFGIVQRLAAPFGGMIGTSYGGGNGLNLQPNNGLQLQAPDSISIQNTAFFVAKAFISTISTPTENRVYVGTAAGGSFRDLKYAAAPTGEIAVMATSASATTISGAGTAAYGNLFYSIGGPLTAANRVAMIAALSAFYTTAGR